MSEETKASEEVIDVPATPEQVNPKDLYFLINGEQLNQCLAIIGKLPYEQVFVVVDIFRALKQVNVTFNDTQTN